MPATTAKATITKIIRRLPLPPNRFSAVLAVLALNYLAFTYLGGHDGSRTPESSSLTWQVREVGSSEVSNTAREGNVEKQECRNGARPTCPPHPPNLRGPLKPVKDIVLEEVENDLKEVVETGGRWEPKHCQPRWSVAIVIPYRDRAHQLGAFLYHMHGILQRQELKYQFYLVEQDGIDPFNRAKLLNVGFVEAKKDFEWDCYAFHDVDLLLENDHHLYHCSPQPRHLAVAMSKLDYRSSHTLAFYKFFGGASLLTKAHMEKVNGWSNVFWGWGGEDDDMWRRLSREDLPVWRFPASIARYTSLLHHTDPVDLKEKRELLRTQSGRHQEDGLRNLRYTLRNHTLEKLFTYLLVDLHYSGL